jgi:DNA-binding NarL/FixJ family response regulator
VLPIFYRMKKICVVFSDSDILHELEKIITQSLFEANYFNPYKSSLYFDFIYDVKPAVTIFESQSSVAKNYELFSKTKVLSGSTTVVIIADHDEQVDCNAGYYFILRSDFNSHLSETIMQEILTGSLLDDVSKHVELTHTEKEVFTFLLRGLTPRKIAYVMRKKYNTIRKHVQNIYSKTGIHHHKSFRIF